MHEKSIRIEGVNLGVLKGKQALQNDQLTARQDGALQVAMKPRPIHGFGTLPVDVIANKRKLIFRQYVVILTKNYRVSVGMCGSQLFRQPALSRITASANSNYARRGGLR